MREMLGDEAERLFSALDTPAEVSIRVNPAKPAEVFEGEAIWWSPNGRYLAERPQFTLDPLMHGGAYYVQEASSQFVAHILRQDNLEGERVTQTAKRPPARSKHHRASTGRA